MQSNYGRYMYLVHGINVGSVLFENKVYDLDDSADGHKLFSHLFDEGYIEYDYQLSKDFSLVRRYRFSKKAIAISNDNFRVDFNVMLNKETIIINIPIIGLAQKINDEVPNNELSPRH